MCELNGIWIQWVPQDKQKYNCDVANSFRSEIMTIILCSTCRPREREFLIRLARRPGIIPEQTPGGASISWRTLSVRAEAYSDVLHGCEAPKLIGHSCVFSRVFRISYRRWKTRAIYLHFSRFFLFVCAGIRQTASFLAIVQMLSFSFTLTLLLPCPS